MNSFQVEEKKVKIQELEVNYKSAGQGSVLLILHGWGRGSDSWKEIAEKLAERRYKVIIPDLPGFGKSQPPSEIWGIQEYAQFVKRFTDSLGFSSFFLLGGSFGGQTAAQFAVSYPASVRKLILSAPAVVRRNPSARKLIFMTISRFFSRVFSFWPLSTCYSLLRKGTYRILGNQDYLYTKGILKQVREKVLSQDLVHILPSVSCPTLVLWGNKDALTPVRDASLIAEQIPCVSLRVFSGVGHRIHQEIPIEFVSAVETFLKQ